MGDGGACTVIGIVVPCFNEADRLDVGEIGDAIERYSDWAFVFVDDGSTDSTRAVLAKLQSRHGTRVKVLDLEPNRGKGEAVRMGMRESLSRGVDIVAYVDADASTPFRELERLIERLQSDVETDVVLGSRVRLLGADVRRSPVRHVVGRVYGTLASLALAAPVYDTQCGAKVFRRTPRLSDALSRPFQERWAFDVELLSRLTGRVGSPAWAYIVEEPLHVWHARAGSKLGPGDGLRAVLGLLRIGWRYRRSASGREVPTVDV